ncbi:MAG TPA: hypothetical protein VLM75_00625 [Spirochaetota bacterium]|nr:hypothetical protein [Spirochaetota bacterium]
MKSGVKILPISVFLAFIAVPAGMSVRAVVPSALYAQTGTEAAGEAIVEKEKREDAGSVEEKREPVVNKETAQPVSPVQRPHEADDETAARKKQAERGTPSQEEPKEAYAGDGLLDVTDGAFKYRRIPGIRITETVAETATPVIATEKSKVSGDEGEEAAGKGLFGMGRSATDTMARVALVGIVILIFVLYRFRARNRRSSVLKRFPKA